MNFLTLLIAIVASISVSAKSGQSISSSSNSDILLRVWKTAANNACSQEMRDAFTEKNRVQLMSQLKSQDKIDDLAEVLNPFLFSLGKSHTEFMTTSSDGYYLFKSHVAMSNPKMKPAPRIINPGVQVGRDQDGYFIREILDGHPAISAGIRKMDRIVAVDGVPFAGSWGLTPRLASIRVRRQEKDLEIKSEIKALDWSQSFQDASVASLRTFSVNGRKIGYVHLWSGVHPQSAQFLAKAVAKLKKQKITSLILDLRGGYGGAWWEHLDPFFRDTSSYMTMEVSNGKQTEVLKSPFKKNQSYFSGPMTVLINEGVRSGKEALAYQFKKTKRAVLIGEKTPGYFTSGQFFFADEPLNYIFYLCVYQLKLDGNVIEGIGIQPDVNVPFEPTGEYFDSQLDRAIEYLSQR